MKASYNNHDDVLSVIENTSYSAYHQAAVRRGLFQKTVDGLRLSNVRSWLRQLIASPVFRAPVREFYYITEQLAYQREQDVRLADKWRSDVRITAR